MRYLSAKTLSEQYSLSPKSARTIIHEIRIWTGAGRYPETSVLDGCGIRVNEDVIIDYLAHRKALRDPIAKQYVEPYRGGHDASGWT